MRRLFLPRCVTPVLGLVVVVLTGCGVGPGDVQAAQEVVYDPQGTPAFAGQALVIQSCGAGAFCHREERDGLEAEDRFGAPNGLDFDLNLGALGADPGEEGMARLRAHQLNVAGTAGLAWSQVSGRHMPPGGDTGTQYEREVEDLGIRFDRFDDAGLASELPGLETEVGREIFRNWLAAGVPVVARTQERAGSGRPVELQVRPACDRECVEPTFESIYRIIVRPTCTSSRCHGGDGAEAGLDLRFREIAGVAQPTHEDELLDVANLAWERLVEDGTLSSTEQCGRSGFAMVEPFDAMLSILYRKFVFASDDPSQCGSRMPLTGAPLNEQRLCAVRTWIDCGACGPEDNSCDTCVDAGRAECRVTAAGECDVEETCPNR